MMILRPTIWNLALTMAKNNECPFINFETLRLWIPTRCHGSILHLAMIIFFKDSDGETKRGIYVSQVFLCDN